MGTPGPRSLGASTCGVLLALSIGAAVVAGGATGDLERVALGAALCVLAAVAAAVLRTSDPITRPTFAEASLLALAVWAALSAMPWPDALARSLAPDAWASRTAALGTAGGVAPSLEVGSTARAALVLASLAFLAAAARVVAARGGLLALLRALTVVVLVHAALGLWRGRYGEDDALLFGWKSENPLNAYGTFPNRTQFAAFLLALLGAPVGLWARSRAVADRALAAVSVLTTAAAVAASGSRAGVLGLVLAAGVVVLGAAGRRRRGLALAFVLGVVGLVVARAAGFEPLVRLLPLRGDEGDRLEIWRGTLRLAAEQPVVGVGLDAFRYAYAGDGRGPLDHWVGIAENDLLQTVSELGLVGTALAAIAAVAAARAASRDLRARGPGAVSAPVAFVGFAALLPLTMTSSPLHQPGVAAAAVLAWAAARRLATGSAAGCDAEADARYGTGPHSSSTEEAWRAS